MVIGKENTVAIIVFLSFFVLLGWSKFVAADEAQRTFEKDIDSVETTDPNFVNQSLARFVADALISNDHKTKSLHYQSVYHNLSEAIEAYVFTYELPGIESLAPIETVNPEEFLEKKERLVELRKSPSSRNEIVDATNELWELEKRLRQRNRYVTIIISATTKKKTVLDRYFGLPHHVYKRGITTLRMARDGRTFARDSKVYFLGPQEIYFSQAASQAYTSKSLRASLPSKSLVSIKRGESVEKQLPLIKQHRVSSSKSKEHKQWDLYRRAYSAERGGDKVKSLERLICVISLLFFGQVGLAATYNSDWSDSGNYVGMDGNWHVYRTDLTITSSSYPIAHKFVVNGMSWTGTNNADFLDSSWNMKCDNAGGFASDPACNITFRNSGDFVIRAYATTTASSRIERHEWHISVLFPNQKPGAPGTPTKTGATRTTLDVKWSAATDRDGSISLYEIEYDCG